MIVMPFPERVGGAEKQLYTLLRNLDRGRIEVAIAFLGIGDLEPDVRALGFPTYVLPGARLRRGGKLISTIRRLRRIFNAEQPELILNWGTKAQVLGWPAASLAGFGDRVVWTQLAVPTRRLDATLLATLLPARAVIASSHVAARAQQDSRPRRRTFVVHPGIDPPRPAAASELDTLRASLGIPADRLVVGTVGRLQELKRQDLLIRALSTLRGNGHDVHGLLVGGNAYNLDPGYERSLHELVDELGMGDRIAFAGQVSDPAPYIQLMDVFVLPSPLEGFGIVVIEAMANGVASIAVATSGPAEIIEHGRSGLLAERADAGLLVEAIEPLLTDTSLRDRLGREGQRRQRELFSANRMTEEITERLLQISAETPSH
jgi:glycosyltransferase involved in cell wall biosynthesis